MKWYFACNDKSHDLFPLIKGAVNSALQNTTLEPHFIYDGENNELTEWLTEKGVKVIHHRVSFSDNLKKRYKDNLNVAMGAFLRCDIPIIEQEDDFILYTDCDVLFLKDFPSNLRPKYFACSSQSEKWNFGHFNTGVMLMNVKNLRKSHQEFCDFIVKNLKLLDIFDQTAYQIFYGGKCTKLDVKYNYKPYWGIDEKAVVIHFHGCKPTSFTSDEELKNFPYVLDVLYRKNPQAYDFYLDLFKKYNSEIEYDYESIEKLKQGIYPLIKSQKNPLRKRIFNKFIKTYKTLENLLNNCK